MVRKALVPLVLVLLLARIAPAAEVPPVVPGAYTLVILPDTQYYARLYPHIFYAQTQWIAAQRDALDIVFVTHEGDLVDTWNVESEWRVAATAMAILDGVVPYGIARGNHDLGDFFALYFPLERYADEPWWGGSRGTTLNETYQVFRMGSADFLILHLMFCPSDAALAWAGQVVAAHPNHHVIVTTHAYLGENSVRTQPGDYYGCGAGTRNTGEEIWTEFVQHYPNIFLVLSGHVPGVGYLLSYGVEGNPVHQLLQNFQYMAVGGNGFLRLLTFDSVSDEVTVQTYSPHLAQFLTGTAFTYTFPFEMSQCGDGVCEPREHCGNCATDCGGCNDGNSCTDDVCDPDVGCLFPAVPNGRSCVDDNVCDGVEECWAGQCLHFAPLPRLGDVDRDGELGADDAQLTFLIALGYVQPSLDEFCEADCNGDGLVSAGDAGDVFRAALGLASCPLQEGRAAARPASASRPRFAAPPTERALRAP